MCVTVCMHLWVHVWVNVYTHVYTCTCTLCVTVHLLQLKVRGSAGVCSAGQQSQVTRVGLDGPVFQCPQHETTSSDRNGKPRENLKV